MGLGAFPPPVPVDAGFPLQPLPPVAVIVNGEDAGGVVPAVVKTCKVVEMSPLVLVVIVLTGLPEGTASNEKVTPAGNPDALSVATQVVPLPLKVTVTKYVAELPAETGLGV